MLYARTTYFIHIYDWFNSAYGTHNILQLRRISPLARGFDEIMNFVWSCCSIEYTNPAFKNLRSADEATAFSNASLLAHVRISGISHMPQCTVHTPHRTAIRDALETTAETFSLSFFVGFGCVNLLWSVHASTHKHTHTYTERIYNFFFPFWGSFRRQKN